MTSDPTTHPHGLRARHKLQSAADFERARRSKWGLVDALFLVRGAANGGDSARLGMAVSVRAVGGAVARNRVRRLIRESFRMHRQALPALDLFVTAKEGASKASNAEIRASLGKLWEDVRSER